jgi:hypothetical protein
VRVTPTASGTHDYVRRARFFDRAPRSTASVHLALGDAPVREDAMSKEELLSRVRELVRQVTEARFEGALYAKLARAHGYADGYMRALMDAGLVDRNELLSVVGSARETTTQESSGARQAA